MSEPRTIPAGFVLVGYHADGTPMYEKAKRNGVLFSSVGYPMPAASQPPIKRIRQSTKPLMNKLETEFCEQLKALSPPPVFLRAQSFRFKLGNGIWYKPDFTCLVPGHVQMRAYEVKGAHAFRGGFENLKVAAHLYPEIRWFLVWKAEGEWREQEVLP